MQLLTGMVPKHGVDFLTWMGVDAKVGTVTHQQMMANFGDMHDVLEGLWSSAVEAQHKRRVQNARANKTKELPRINVGDFVLVAMATRARS